MSPYPELSSRTRRRIAWRLLPFIFVIFLIDWIDRVNVAYANLRMSAELGFSDKVYGLGVGLFAIGFVIFEIPGALIVERWSARKWIARIMISWGVVTILTGFIHTAPQFYLARFALGLAEASLFPGLIAYLTHWFRAEDRARAISCLYAGIPTAALIGAPVAGLLLPVHWFGISGWRWLFIVEGIPAVLFGVVTILYLTDWPSQAKWLRKEEQDWITSELEAEKTAKKRIRDFTIWQAFSDKRVLLLTLAWFFAASAGNANSYWLPTFVKRLSGLPNSTVTSLLIIPAFASLAGIILNSWHSDKTGERRRHAAIPVLVCGLLYLLVFETQHHFALTMMVFATLGLFLSAGYPVIWSLPSVILCESAAAATFGFINSIGQLGGFVGPYAVGYLNDLTHSLGASFACIGFAYLVSTALLLLLRIEVSEKRAPTVEKTIASIARP